MSLSVKHNGKKMTLRPSPATTLSKVLEQVCAKHGLPKHDYCLWYSGKALDLSLPYRLCSVPAGASLELKRRTRKPGGSAAKVRIALQTPSGRLQGTFSTSDTLWSVLVQVEERGTAPLLTKQSRDGRFLLPAITYLTTRIASLEELATTTLLSIGVSGSALLRVEFVDSLLSLADVDDVLSTTAIRSSYQSSESKARAQQESMEKLREQEVHRRLEKAEEEQRRAREEGVRKAAQQKRRTEENGFRTEAEEKRRVEEDDLQKKVAVEERGAREVRSGEGTGRASKRARDMEMTDSGSPFNHPTENHALRSSSPEAEIEPIHFSQLLLEGREEIKRELALDRQPAVFAPSDVPFDPKKFEVPEEFFEITSDDIATIAESNWKRKQEQDRSNILMTRALREKHRLGKIPNYLKTLIRVRFPDRLDLQGTFHPDETPTSVTEFVRSRLKFPDEPFYLYTTPPPERVDCARTLRWQLLCPAAILHFAWENKGNDIKEYLRDDLEVLPSDASSAPINMRAFRAASTAAKVSSSEFRSGGHVLGRQRDPARDTNRERKPAPGKSKVLAPKESSKPPKWLKLGK